MHSCYLSPVTYHLSMSKQTKSNNSKLHISLIKQLLTLSTAGFGLAAALAWNDTIQTLINEKIKPFVAQGSGLLWQAIYATVITIVAVLITYYLTKVIRKLENK